MVAVIFFFLGRMLWENWIQVKEASFAFEPFRFIGSTLLFSLCYFIQIGAWYLITVKLGIALSFSETLKTWFSSQLGKYLPGKVWLLLSRFYFYESKGKSKKAISVALYFETVTMVTAAALLFWASLFLFRGADAYRLGRESRGWELLFIPVFILLHPRILEKLFNRVLRWLGKDPVVLSLSYRDVLWILFVCLVSWMAGGIGFYLFVDSVFPVPAGSVLYLMGALACSSVLGLIALFAPGGLGVREGVLVYLLTFTLPGSVAVVLSILTRLWMTLIEIGLIGVIYLIDRFQNGMRRKGFYGSL